MSTPTNTSAAVPLVQPTLNRSDQLKKDQADTRAKAEARGYKKTQSLKPGEQYKADLAFLKKADNARTAAKQDIEPVHALDKQFEADQQHLLFAGMQNSALFASLPAATQATNHVCKAFKKHLALRLMAILPADHEDEENSLMSSFTCFERSGNQAPYTFKMSFNGKIFYDATNDLWYTVIGSDMYEMLSYLGEGKFENDRNGELVGTSFRNLDGSISYTVYSVEGDKLTKLEEPASPEVDSTVEIDMINSQQESQPDAEDVAKAAFEAEEAAKVAAEADRVAKAALEAEEAAKVAAEAERVAKAALEAEEAAKVAAEAARVAKAALEAEEAAKVAAEAARVAKAALEAEEAAKVAAEAERVAKAALEAEEAAKVAADADRVAKAALEAEEDAKAVDEIVLSSPESESTSSSIEISGDELPTEAEEQVEEPAAPEEAAEEPAAPEEDADLHPENLDPAVALQIEDDLEADDMKEKLKRMKKNLADDVNSMVADYNSKIDEMIKPALLKAVSECKSDMDSIRASIDDKCKEAWNKHGVILNKSALNKLFKGHASVKAAPEIEDAELTKRKQELEEMKARLRDMQAAASKETTANVSKDAAAKPNKKAKPAAKLNRKEKSVAQKHDTWDALREIAPEPKIHPRHMSFMDPANEVFEEFQKLKYRNYTDNTSAVYDDACAKLKEVLDLAVANHKEAIDELSTLESELKSLIDANDANALKQKNAAAEHANVFGEARARALLEWRAMCVIRRNWFKRYTQETRKYRAYDEAKEQLLDEELVLANDQAGAAKHLALIKRQATKLSKAVQAHLVTSDGVFDAGMADQQRELAKATIEVQAELNSCNEKFNEWQKVHGTDCIAYKVKLTAASNDANAKLATAMEKWQDAVKHLCTWYKPEQIQLPADVCDVFEDFMPTSRKIKSTGDDESAPKKAKLSEKPPSKKTKSVEDPAEGEEPAPKKSKPS